MSIISLEEPNYKLEPVKFSVDDILGDHIMEPFPNQSFFWLIVGAFPDHVPAYSILGSDCAHPH